MNKHEEARKLINDELHIGNDNEWICQYINECEATEKAYEELKRDVKRCIMIDRKIIFHTASHDEVKDCELLKIKLSKVGVEND